MAKHIDGNAYNYGYIGSRATGSEAGSYLVAGPDWKGEAPAGINKVFRSTTPFGLTIFRTRLFNPEDMPNVVKVQAGYKAEPLSAFLQRPAPPAAPKIDLLPATTKGIKEIFSPISMPPSSSCRSHRTTRRFVTGLPVWASVRTKRLI